ncbi:MAG: bifunctional UDP-sugar hydrolase/5'-nucleotidase [Candidatus Eremiobacterota bacterium]
MKLPHIGINNNLNRINFSPVFRQKEDIFQESFKEPEDLKLYTNIFPCSSGSSLNSNNIISSAPSIAASAMYSLHPSPSGEALKTLNIIYTNDIHGTILPVEDKKNYLVREPFGGVSYMGTIIKNLKEETEGKNLLLDGGDFAQGSYESGLTRGKTMIEIMNNLGYDAIEIGNHEFDWSRESLENMVGESNCPVLGGNVINEQERLLNGILPYTIKEVNGLRVGIIGLITPETKEIASPKNIEGLKFLAQKETVKKYIGELKDKGVDLITVLSHCGDIEDEKLAAEVRGIDLIVGGHSHTAMEEAKKINDTIIVQAGCQSKFVGNLQINVDGRSKKIVSYNNKLIPVANQTITPDPEIEKIIAPVVEEAGKKKSEVMGITEVGLTHDRSKVTESIMGNVLTDAMREGTGASVAVMNSGGIRSQIKKGQITFGDIYRVLPFDDVIVSINLTGKQIKDLMESSASRTRGNLHISGMTVDIDPSKPAGDKVSNIKIQGKPLDYNSTYSVATGDFLAKGGDWYDTFKEGKNLQYHNKMIIDGLKDYIRNHSPITSDTAKIEGRLNFLTPPPRHLSK